MSPSDGPMGNGMPDGDRLERQLRFLREIDRVKDIQRQSWLLDLSRKENDAEHSWHLGVMAAMLAEYAAEPVDVARVVRMVLLHDVVEIDAGDTFVYDDPGQAEQHLRESRAADRIFAILPADQAAEARALWDEFEARQTPEAKFAAALDRLQPLMHNYFTEGAAWREHGVKMSRVIQRNRHMADGSPRLWAYAESLIRDAVEKGFLDAD